MANGSAPLDEFQRSALDECAPPCRVSVLGAPGTGKTRLLEALVAREAAAPGGRIAVITFDRRAAGALYDSMSLRLGSLSERVGVHTLTAFAYSIVQAYAQAVGRRDPELISGPEEDALLAEILGDADAPIEFPEFVTDDLRATKGFRSQIRDLITRASELGCSSGRLERLGRRLGEPMWVAGAHVLDLYESVTAAQDAFAGSSQSPDRLDHARLVGAATAMLRNWDGNVSREPQARRFSRPRWDWVLVDDVHNAPGSIVALLAELACDGASIVVTGDPDASVQGFRGALASLPGDVTRLLGCRPVPLRRRHRAGRRIAGLADRIAGAIRVGGGAIAQREPAPATGEDLLEGRRFVNGEEENAWIAHTLREAHLLGGTSYADMAVMTRSRSAHAGIRASLVRRGIPVGQIGTDRPLREEPAVAALLDLVRLALPDRDGAPDVRDVLAGPMVAIDPLRLRQLGRTLRGWELAGGGERGEEALLALVLDGPEAVERAAPRGADDLVRAARLVARIRRAYENSRGQAEEVLWAAWDAAGVAEGWRRAALAGGVDADAADSSLDAVIQLFRVAQRMADRDAAVSVEDLLRELQSQDLPQDSIARSGSSVESVTLTTPAASIGREWDILVIAQLQDGLWPNMRLRDAFTHTNRLAQVVSGRDVEGLDEAEARREAVDDVVDDELRQLHHAVTRAGRRLVLTCVDGEGARPSRFFDLMGFVEPSGETGDASQSAGGSEERAGRTAEPSGRGAQGCAAGEGDGGAPMLREAGPLPARFDAAGLVSSLRRDALSGDQDAADLLASLARAGFAQADPARWPDALDVTDAEGLADDASVRVSPSRVEILLDCPLRGFLSSIGGEPSDDRRAAEIGTLVHAIAERHPDGTRDELLEAFERAWRFLPESPGTAEFDRLRARAMVELLAAYLSDYRLSGAGRARVENPVKAPAGGGVVLSGKIDRIEPTPDGWKVVDFKTGKYPVSAKAAQDSVQLQLYQWAVEQVEGEGSTAGADLVYLGKASRGGPAIRRQGRLDAESRECARQRIHAAAGLLRGGEFAAVASEENCRTCRFAKVCPARNEGRMFS